MFPFLTRLRSNPLAVSLLHLGEVEGIDRPVAVEVEERLVAPLTTALAVRGLEREDVGVVHVAIAVGVAEEPLDGQST